MFSAYILNCKKRLYVLAISFAMLFSFPVYSGGLSLVNVDVPSSYDVNLELGPDTLLLLDNMPMNIRQQLDLFVELLFKEQLTPLLYDIDAILEERIHDTAEVANEILANRLNQVSDILREVIKEFSEASIGVISQVRQQLLVETSTQVSKLRKEFMHDFARLIDCTIWSKYEQTKIDIAHVRMKIADGFAFWQETPKCYKKVGIPKGGVIDIEYTKVYDLKKCEVESGINEHTPIRQVRGAYVDLIKWAKTMSCVSGSAAGIDFYYTDILDYGKKYRAWTGVSK